MKNTFQYVSAENPDLVRIEKVVAGKQGLIVDPGFAAQETTAVALDADGYRYDVIKGYRLVAAVAPSDTTIKIAKGSGILNGEFLGYGTKSVACTAIDITNPDYDLVTVTMGLTIAAGEVLYQAKAASADAAEIIYKPDCILGAPCDGNIGDEEKALIVMGTIRKETCCVGKDVLALLPTIKII